MACSDSLANLRTGLSSAGFVSVLGLFDGEIDEASEISRTGMLAKVVQVINRTKRLKV